MHITMYRLTHFYFLKISVSTIQFSKAAKHLNHSCKEGQNAVFINHFKSVRKNETNLFLISESIDFILKKSF